MKIRFYKRMAVALTALLASTCIYSPAQAWVNNSVEAVTYGGSLADASNAVAEDSNQNIYVGSDFRGSVDFDPTPGFDTRTSNSSLSPNNDDIAVSKFDPNGDRIWTYIFSGAGDDEVQDIKIDSNGNIYISGTFVYTLDFDPTSGVDSRTAVGALAADAFITKIDSSGNYLWTRTFGGDGIDRSYVMEIDQAGNLLLGGIFANTADFNPSPSAINNLTASGNDAFVVKINSNGEYLWAIKLGGGGGDQVFGLATGTSGEVFISGIFNTTADLNPGIGVNNATSLGGADHFIVKLDSDGGYQWSSTLGSTGQEYYRSSLISDSQNNAYLALRMDGNLSFTSLAGTETFTVNGAADIEVFKFSTSGTLQWGRQLRGAGTDRVEDLEIDAASNLYVGGAVGSGGLIYLDPADSSTTLTSNGSTDGFIWKLSSAGGYLGYSRFGGTAADILFDLDLSSSGKILANGTFTGTMSIDTGSGSQSFTSNGLTDVFMVRINSIAGAAQNSLPTITISSVSSNVYKGISSSVTASTNTAGRVQFLINGKRVANCVSIRTTGTAPSLTASCNWRPTVQGSVVLRAKLIVDSATAVISEPKLISVQRRTNSR